MDTPTSRLLRRLPRASQVAIAQAPNPIQGLIQLLLYHQSTLLQRHTSTPLQQLAQHLALDVLMASAVKASQPAVLHLRRFDTAHTSRELAMLQVTMRGAAGVACIEVLATRRLTLVRVLHPSNIDQLAKVALQQAKSIRLMPHPLVTPAHAQTRAPLLFPE